MSLPSETAFLPYWSEAVPYNNPHPDCPDVGPILLLTNYTKHGERVARASLAAGTPEDYAGYNAQSQALTSNNEDRGSWAYIPTVGASDTPDSLFVRVKNGARNLEEAAVLAGLLRNMHDGFRDHFDVSSFYMIDHNLEDTLGTAVVSGGVVTRSAMTPAGEHLFEMPAQGLVTAFLRVALRRAVYLEHLRRTSRQLPHVPKRLELPAVPSAA